MSIITPETLARIAQRPINDNMRSVCLGIEARGKYAGLDQPHRLAHYLAQLGHESAGFHYDREVWGPTAAQKRYEGRADLGNTLPGDGSKFRGYTAAQITGRHNTTAFHDWCLRMFVNVPDFVAFPHLMNTDPWEGLGPVWYWEIGNPTGKPLSPYADANNIEMLTRRWNGGMNGYADRLDWYTRAALALLGYSPKAVTVFQVAAGIEADGIAGPRTRAELHAALKALTKPPTLWDRFANFSWRDWL